MWLGERDAWQGKLYLPPNVSRTNGEISAFASGKHPSFSLMQLSTRSLNTCRWRWVLTIYCSSERSLKCSRKLFFCTFNLAELLWCETQLIMNAVRAQTGALITRWIFRLQWRIEICRRSWLCPHSEDCSEQPAWAPNRDGYYYRLLANEEDGRGPHWSPFCKLPGLLWHHKLSRWARKDQAKDELGHASPHIGRIV